MRLYLGIGDPHCQLNIDNILNNWRFREKIVASVRMRSSFFMTLNTF